jgi:hypothetical protein
MVSVGVLLAYMRHLLDFTITELAPLLREEKESVITGKDFCQKEDQLFMKGIFQYFPLFSIVIYSGYDAIRDISAHSQKTKFDKIKNFVTSEAHVLKNLKEQSINFIHNEIDSYLSEIKKPANMGKKHYDSIKKEIIKLEVQEVSSSLTSDLPTRLSYHILLLNGNLKAPQTFLSKAIANCLDSLKDEINKNKTEAFKKMKDEFQSRINQKSKRPARLQKQGTNESFKEEKSKELQQQFNQAKEKVENLFVEHISLYDALQKNYKEAATIPTKLQKQFNHIFNESNPEHYLKLNQNFAEITEVSNDSLQRLLDLQNLLTAKTVTLQKTRKQLQFLLLKSLPSENDSPSTQRVETKEEPEISPAKRKEMERQLSFYEKQYNRIKTGEIKNQPLPQKKKATLKEKKKNPGFFDAQIEESNPLIYERVRNIKKLLREQLEILDPINLDEMKSLDKQAVATFLTCLIQDLARNLPLGDRTTRKFFGNNAKYELKHLLGKNPNIQDLLDALIEYTNRIVLDSEKSLAFCRDASQPVESSLLQRLLGINSEIARRKELEQVEKEAQGLKEERIVLELTAKDFDKSTLLSSQAKSYMRQCLVYGSQDAGIKSGNYTNHPNRWFHFGRGVQGQRREFYHPPKRSQGI